jgi:hypothetical protein
MRFPHISFFENVYPLFSSSNVPYTIEFTLNDTERVIEIGTPAAVVTAGELAALQVNLSEIELHTNLVRLNSVLESQVRAEFSNNNIVMTVDGYDYNIYSVSNSAGKKSVQVPVRRLNIDTLIALQTNSAVTINANMYNKLNGKWYSNALVDYQLNVNGVLVPSQAVRAGAPQYRELEEALDIKGLPNKLSRRNFSVATDATPNNGADAAVCRKEHKNIMALDLRRFPMDDMLSGVRSSGNAANILFSWNSQYSPHGADGRLEVFMKYKVLLEFVQGNLTVIS